jgi:hypothetical protein
LTQIDKQISRLETRAAKVELTETALGGGDEDSDGTDEANLSGDSGFSGYGEPPSLPEAMAGEVSVVQNGLDQSGTVPVVIQNGTDEPITVDQVIGTARDANGKLVAQADYGTIAPHVLQPGEYAVGSLIFGFDDLPDDTVFEFDVEINPSYDSTVDLEVTEAELTDSGIVGVATNQLDRELDPSSIAGVCWDSNGTLIGVFSGSTSKDKLPPGDTSPFDGYFYMSGVGLFDTPSPANVCAYWVVAALAYDFN